MRGNALIQLYIYMFRVSFNNDEREGSIMADIINKYSYKCIWKC